MQFTFETCPYDFMMLTESAKPSQWWLRCLLDQPEWCFSESYLIWAKLLFTLNLTLPLLVTDSLNLLLSGTVSPFPGVLCWIVPTHPHSWSYVEASNTQCSSPPYLWGIHSKVPSGCLKFQIAPNLIYTYHVFSLYIHNYDKVSFIN